MADRVAVMYAGHIIEQADVDGLFDRPLHPYTQGLIGSLPIPGADKDRLEAIPGSVPDLRSEEHTSELQPLMRNSYAVFCLKKKKNKKKRSHILTNQECI